MPKTIQLLVALAIAGSAFLGISNSLSLKALKTAAASNTDPAAVIDGDNAAVRAISARLATLEGELQALKTARATTATIHSPNTGADVSKIAGTQHASNPLARIEARDLDKRGSASLTSDTARSEALETRFDAETADMPYSSALQTRLVSEFQKFELTGQELQWLECRQTVCRMGLRAESGVKNDELMFVLAGSLENEFTAQTQVESDGSTLITLHMLRSE